MSQIETIAGRARTSHPQLAPAVDVGHEDGVLVLRHAPRIRFDHREPFFPVVAGYTVLRQDGPSPSFPRQIDLPPGAAVALEYAIWWDWDIQHLYELEHVWVYLDADEHVVRVEASWHGKFNVMLDADGQLPLEDGHVTLFAEPGKHALAPDAQTLRQRAGATRRDCGPLAGVRGLHVTELFRRELRPTRNPYVNWLAFQYMRQQRFIPSYVFSNVVDLATIGLVPWTTLEAWIPDRVDWWMRRLYLRRLQEKQDWLAQLPLELPTGDLPPIIQHVLELSTQDRPESTESSSLRDLAWWPTMAVVTSLINGARLGWLLEQNLMNALARLGFRGQTRFAHFREDVIADVLAYGLRRPPVPAPVVVEQFLD